MPQQFVVPQFIDVEDKILGPISVRQFIIMLGGGGLLVLAYQILIKLANQMILFIITAVGIFILVALFSFVRVSGRPFHLFLLNVLQSMKDPHLRLWNNMAVEHIQYRKEPAAPLPPPTKQPITQTKLARLALLVDTGGAFHEDADIQYWGQTLPKQTQEKESPTDSLAE